MNREDIEQISVIKPQEIKTRYGSVRYRSWGSTGTPLVCLPGWPASSLSYAPLAAVLHPQKIIAMDFPGWAGTPIFKMDFTKIDSYAAVVEESVVSLGIEKDFNLLGHSFGGVVAQAVLNRNIIKPSKTVLSSTFHSDSRIFTQSVFGPGLLVFKGVLALHLPYGVVMKQLRAVYNLVLGCKRYLRRWQGTEILKAASAENWKGNPKVLANAAKVIRGMELLSRTAHSYSPLLLYGDKDFGFVKKEMAEIAQAHGTQPYVLPHVDHFHIFFEPEKAGEKIVEFLAS